MLGARRITEWARVRRGIEASAVYSVFEVVAAVGWNRQSGRRGQVSVAGDISSLAAPNRRGAAVG